MRTEFGEKLEKAMNDVNSLTWKDKNGNVIKLVDAPAEDLIKWYKHAYEMLYNNSPFNPGKVTIKNTLLKTWDSCNTELFMRWLLHEKDIPGLKTKMDLLNLINAYKADSDEDILNQSISTMFDGLDPIFERITVSRLMDACFDKLDVLNKKMITDKFILSQGIWLTDEEKIELTETDERGKMRNRMDVIKERLCLPNDVKIRICPTGLSFAEFRSLVQLSTLPKISSLSTIALRTLRDKILLLLDNDMNYHIDKWNTILNNIKRVAERRHINLEEYIK